MAFGTIEQALADLRAGKFVVVADDEDRENEGDLICAAELITPEMVNFMMRAKGMICLALTNDIADRMDLPLMGREQTDAFRTAYTITIDAAPHHGVTTGISAADQAKTIRVAVDPRSTPADLRRPGHVHPLRARSGGVLQRTGHTEAAVDLARAAGLTPAGVICEILNEDGTTAKRPQLEVYAREHGLTFITVAQLVAWRLRTERLVRRVADAKLPTDFGEFRIVGFENDVDRAEHVALVYGDLGDGEDIGLLNKLKAYGLQDAGKDTVEANEALGFQADLRNFGIGAQILLDLGVRSIRVMTNNPKKVVGVEGYGLRISGTERIQAPETAENADYLRVKREKLGHLKAL
ncbi:MAG: 3,4-dihydroxy-2-butanone-4-phosphate synthase [Gemmatimonadaceae bacterium]|nr:3,4-dihydroxy-2-butanone-4-phosphate synthase [Gemmatimonadaceae bacterium]